MALRRARQAPAESVLPGYTELTEIGGGAFATVFRAVEADTGRKVALKILKVDTIHAHLIETFHHEIQALAKVSDHPNIVTLYRPSTTTDGRPVLVLELCKESLGQQLRAGGPLVPEEVTRIGVKIAGALETAHRNGFLHRDMKPQNILITQFGEPALADFGVAALQASAQVTAGVFGFTTLHAAPEMLEGHHLSPATDIYGLASTMYQLLTGQAPFASFDNEAPASVILRILRDPVRPLRADNVPLALADLLEAALSKQPDGRPRTALDFAHALQTVQESQGWAVTDYTAWGAAGGPAGPVGRGGDPGSGPPWPWPTSGAGAAARTGPVPGGVRAGPGAPGPPPPGVAPLPGRPAAAAAGPAPAGDANRGPLYQSAPSVRVEVDSAGSRSVLPPLLPPPAPTAGSAAPPPAAPPPAGMSTDAVPPPSPPPPPPPPPPAPLPPVRRPSLEVPDQGVRHVVAPFEGRRGQPSRPLEPPRVPLAPLGPSAAPPAPAPPPAPLGAADLRASFAPPTQAPVGPPPSRPSTRPVFVEPTPVQVPDGAESVYERTAHVSEIFSARSRPAPAPARTDGATGRPVSGLPAVAVAGLVVAGLVVLAAVLLLLGVI